MAKWSDMIKNESSGDGQQQKDGKYFSITRAKEDNTGLSRVKFIPTVDGNEYEDIWTHYVNKTTFQCLGKNNGCPACAAGLQAKTITFANVFQITDDNAKDFKPGVKLMKMTFNVRQSIKDHGELKGTDLYGYTGQVVVLGSRNKTWPRADGSTARCVETYISSIKDSPLTKEQYEEAIKATFNLIEEKNKLIKTADEILNILSNSPVSSSDMINDITIGANISGSTKDDDDIFS